MRKYETVLFESFVIGFRSDCMENSFRRIRPFPRYARTVFIVVVVLPFCCYNPTRTNRRQIERHFAVFVDSRRTRGYARVRRFHG